MKLNANEIDALQDIHEKSKRQIILYPLKYIAMFSMFGCLPLKLLPAFRNSDQLIITEFGAIKFVIVGIFFLSVYFIMLLDTLKYFGVKKDLKQRDKYEHEAFVIHPFYKKGIQGVILKGKIKNIVFSQHNFVKLQSGEKIRFEVFKNSKILIKVTKVFAGKYCLECNFEDAKSSVKCPKCGIVY